MQSCECRNGGAYLPPGDFFKSFPTGTEFAYWYTMDQVRTLTHAYSQAPWRKQIQIIVTFLLVLVLGALVASVYLYVTSQSIAAGVDAQRLHVDISEARLMIEDYQSKLAELTSERTMAERAAEMGFKPVEPSQMLYVAVPGYTGREPEVMVAPTKPAAASTDPMLPAYSESLIDWFAKNILAPSGWFNEVEP